MKERPMFYSTPMVKAVLADLKDITRRAQGLDAINALVREVTLSSTFVNSKGQLVATFLDRGTDLIQCACPYGQPGDILWVRETWREYHPVDADGYTNFNETIIEFAADDPEMIPMVDGDGVQMYNKDGSEKFIPWKPSIHLKKKHSRTKLEILSIRVERLHDITEEDAIREGVLFCDGEILGRRFKDYMGSASEYGHPDYDYPTVSTAKESFGTLWASINGQDSWDSNPWVWRIEFKKCL